MRLVHVGDSRAYLLRDGRLHIVTKDHTVVAKMVEEGEITAAEAETHPHRNIVTRVVGVESSGPGRRGDPRRPRRRPAPAVQRRADRHGLPRRHRRGPADGIATRRPRSTHSSARRTPPAASTTSPPCCSTSRTTARRRRSRRWPRRPRPRPPRSGARPRSTRWRRRSAPRPTVASPTAPRPASWRSPRRQRSVHRPAGRGRRQRPARDERWSASASRSRCSSSGSSGSGCTWTRSGTSGSRTAGSAIFRGVPTEVAGFELHSRRGRDLRSRPPRRPRSRSTGRAARGDHGDRPRGGRGRSSTASERDVDRARPDRT